MVVAAMNTAPPPPAPGMEGGAATYRGASQSASRFILEADPMLMTVVFPTAGAGGSGRRSVVVVVDGDAGTWTFDVCTNTWAQQATKGSPPTEWQRLVYDAASDRFVVPPGLPASLPQPDYRLDVATARHLLAEAGRGGGFDTTMVLAPAAPADLTGLGLG